MGCAQSKVECETTNGSAVPVPEPAGPPPTDPRLPLTPRQLFLLQKSWKGIKRNMEATGVEMFIKFFQTNANLKSLFTQFDGVEVNENLRDNTALEMHGSLVMGIIDEAITDINNVDKVEELLLRTRNKHAGMTEFQNDFFWRMEAPFIQSLKVILEDRYTDQMDEIYRTAIKFILVRLSGCERPEPKETTSSS